MMKINFSPPTSAANLQRLKERYGDDWSIEMTSFLGPIIHYWARKPNGEKFYTFQSNETIDREDLRLLQEDRKQRGLSPIHDEGTGR